MRKFKLIINPFAEIDMKVAKEWYDFQKELLGDKFIEEAEIVLSRIITNPFQFPETLKDIRKANLNRFPFSIYFTISKSIIIVFAVFHNKRNPVIWKNRLR